MFENVIRVSFVLEPWASVEGKTPLADGHCLLVSVVLAVNKRGSVLCL